MWKNTNPWFVMGFLGVVVFSLNREDVLGESFSLLHNLLWRTDGLLGGKLRQLRLGRSNLISYHSSLLAMLNVVDVFPAYLKTWCWICFSAMLTISCQSLVLVFLPYCDLPSGQNILKIFFFFSKFSSWHMTIYVVPNPWYKDYLCLYQNHMGYINNTVFGTLCKKLFS